MAWGDHTRGVTGMTAPTVGRKTLINTLIMAGPAFRHTMRAAEREPCQVMIKAGLLPEVLRVTVLARHQLAIMRIILMMALAAFLTGTLQDPLIHMTGLAIKLQMNTCQQEVLVILRGILPAAFVMALRTERTI
jgi:hypothetical protein